MIILMRVYYFLNAVYKKDSEKSGGFEKYHYNNKTIMKTYDFGISWSGNELELFIKIIKEACKQKKLSFLWISSDNVREIVKKLEASQLRIRLLLDTEATYNKKGDPYARVAYAVKDAGGVVINDPDRARVATDKSIVHFELIDRGILNPYTVIVRNWEPKSFRLTENEKRKLGTSFIIKPATGYGQMGVIKDAKGTISEIARARNYDSGDNFLLQEKIHPIHLNGKRAWFRVFHIFDHVIPCWWDDKTNLYKHITNEEFNNFQLLPLARIVTKIADITRMVWFSTEIAIDEKDKKKRFIAIDYVNDQCDMSAKSETVSGVPDAIVGYTANAVVDSAERLIKGEKGGTKYLIWLKDAKIEVRGLGSPTDILKPK